ncbi:MAG: hypothetical protein RBR06_06170 [Desulfuromonadaceae bacterium]|nr:hypothetical protein [Desulfuromonadaceae bacterium]
MNTPPPLAHPADVMRRCIEKSAFLTDAISAIATFEPELLSTAGLNGLATLLGELEQSLQFVQTQREKESAI